ncbi:O(6)-alkylguanine repair protein YbaZ [Longilinea arvoryzae]|uniref:O(6)-alkylguanine repair protein YbaZ n=1 Tax=Longilinea arvoryzae TaxID=360412 RepID=A0A0S7BL92_9CHLR|nr:MGMT family protein [Longilinea arvoryzae]GAP14673.1 O(6)-alkylguanine repair protein YbaZ [Longilinea arvoryzae]
MVEKTQTGPRLYDRIYNAVRQIPAGRVATYGQIARLVGGCSAQMVGFALAALPNGSDVPWQRVINAQGKVSPHGVGFGSMIQRTLLEEEGVVFNLEGIVDLKTYGW